MKQRPKVTRCDASLLFGFGYADPTNYQIFVGNPSQYQKYQQLRLANNMAQDQLETAQMNTWGPGLWGFPE